MNDIVESIKRHEGYEPMVYKCTAGYDTIGYGFAVKDLELSPEVSDMILKEKLNNIIPKIQKKLPWFADSPDNIKLVIVNMVYQMGLSGVLKFKKALAAMKLKDWETAATEMLDSRWAKQTPNRAKELAQIVREV